MKKTIIICLFLVSMVTGFSGELFAKVKTDDALKVADNWIALIISKKGSWGGSKTAYVDEIVEFRKNDRKIGYFCRIRPHGFIIVSLRKGLAPVKAYSATTDLDPESDEGMADFLKGKMEKILQKIERRHGPLDTVSDKDLQEMLQINYKAAWDELVGPDGEKTSADLQSTMEAMDYQGGDYMLSSYWHQRDPYNRYTPSGETCDHTLVGCVATAGAQIMRYWNWPPYGEGTFGDPYDWANMLDGVTADSLSASIDAVAELSYEVGVSVGMDYGCGDSYAGVGNMVNVYKYAFRYSDIVRTWSRDSYSAEGWFNLLKNQFNMNRPVQYRVVGHSIVGDGWQEIGSLPTRQYHMNYGGQGTSSNTWYALDELELGDINEEYVVLDIVPVAALGDSIAGTYAKEAFPYRYFDRSVTGSGVIFQSGQNLQFLPGVRLSGDASGVVIYGAGNGETRIFSDGPVRGVKVSADGGVKLKNNGGMSLLPVGAPRYLKVDSYDGTQIDLAWERGRGIAASYEIERSEEGAPYTVYATVSETTFSDTNLTPETEYCYRVRAIGSGGSRSEKKQVCRTTAVVPEVSIGLTSGIHEGNTGVVTAKFPVFLDQATSMTVSVDYTTQDQSATAGSDYNSASGTLTFPPNSTFTYIEVNVIGDTDYEGDEEFLVLLSNPQNCTIGAYGTQGVIIDDD